jgi:putative endonuclease
MFYVYILYSSTKDKYYIGQTQDIQERIITHNTRKNLGANDWELKYSEAFETRSEAILRESEIKKKKRRTYLEHLISSAG